ncbi:alpha-L-fucosidase [Flagellimonas pacifica]|uniref:alpha-L-fucosidase n=1 Tax=Flagellimonas pacifica TaxID=1247520 RepID=A0A285N2Q9_9FLAO|nr:alpha-L-fucosidase [Allomuricauda parva]SNZ02031.1 Alpha-L-fucosidase [Allomuricauda parva]
MNKENNTKLNHKKALLLWSCLILLSNLILAQKDIPIPTPGQVAWQDSEIGVLFHFDIAIPAGDFSPNNTSKKVFDPKLYNPEKLDTDQWIKAAKAAGATYAIFTATHFNGFLQWQSDLYPYGLKQSPWRDGKGDIVGDFVASCRKFGIKPGIYISTHRNFYQGLWGHFVDWGSGKGSKKQEIFNRLAEKMTEEICSRYGDLMQIWYDAGVKLPHEGGPDVLPIFDKYQPNSVFYNSSKRSDHRWVGNEAGYADYPCWSTMPKGDNVSHNAENWKPILGKGDPNGKIWSPAMVDVPLRVQNGVHNWFWSPNQEHGISSTNQLLDMYYNSVGHNSNLLLGVVINPTGLVPDPDMNRLKEFGDEIKYLFSNPLAITSGSGKHLSLKIKKKQKIDHVVLMEDITQGERVREFQVEGRTKSGWKVLAKGSCIGHKYIAKFDKTEVFSLRLVVTKSIAKPFIREFSIYNTDKK